MKLYSGGLQNTRLMCKWPAMINALAYNIAPSIAAKKVLNYLLLKVEVSTFYTL